MLVGRQRASLWASFAVGAGLIALSQHSDGGRPRTLGEPARLPQGAVELSWREEPPVIAPEVAAAAARNGLDPALVQAVIMTESGNDSTAVSPRGAVGPMQVLPETAAELGLPEAADPAIGLEAGCRYLAALLDHFGGDVELALAAYNAGPGAVRRWGGVPPYCETRTFIARVSATYGELTGLSVRSAWQGAS